MKLRVMVEINPETNRVVRIFKYPAAALFLDPAIIRELPRKEAVEDVRKQVFEASGGVCRDCPRPLTWDYHLHEDVHRSKNGEISIFNSVAVCSECHRKIEHGKRAPQFSKGANNVRKKI